MVKKPIKINEIYANFFRLIEYFLYHVLYYMLIGPLLIPLVLML